MEQTQGHAHVVACDTHARMEFASTECGRKTGPGV